MSHYKPYPEYKDSGVEWIGEVPAHWEVKKVKFLASVTPSGVDKLSDSYESSVRFLSTSAIYHNDYIDDAINLESATASENERERLLLKKGDIIITKDSVVPDRIAEAAFVKESLTDVICGYHLVRVCPFEIGVYPSFIFFAISNRRANSYFLSRARGTTIIGLSYEVIANAMMPCPGISEQSQIATFLDRETTRIDTLVEKKQRFIELLEEKRQAVITQAVTKGLDPNVPMKDSGVAWIGEVPAHWGVMPLRRLCTLQTGSTPPTSEEDNYTDDGIPWARPEDIKEDSLVVEPSRMLTSKGASYTREIAENSLLISCIGTIGRVGFVRYPITTNQQITAATFYSESAFYLYFLSAARSEVESLSVGNVISILNTERLGDLMAVTPPPHEAELIANFLGSEFEAIGSLIEKTRESIELLKERRSALITAAVTGKIDVREEAAA